MYVCILTPSPNARSSNTLAQVLLQSSMKRPSSASCAAKDGGSGCWALPSLNSPKFIALGAGRGGGGELEAAFQRDTKKKMPMVPHRCGNKECGVCTVLTL